MTYSDQGVILRRNDFREAERLITLFGKESGKITLRAPGAKKATSRKTYHLETFNQIYFLAARGRNFDVITETRIANDFSLLKNDLRKVAMSYYISELVDRLTREGEGSEKIFQMLMDFLLDLDKEVLLSDASFDLRLRKFETELLEVLGFWPHNSFEKFDQGNPSEWEKFNKSLIEWVLEGSLKSEGFLHSLRSGLAGQGPTF